MSVRSNTDVVEAPGGDAARPVNAVVVDRLVKRYQGRQRGQEVTIAVDHLSFSIPVGKTYGLVGESGSGKSTVARCLLGLVPSDGGRVNVLGREISTAKKKDLRRWRRDMQIVFQEPYEALDPRIKVGAAIAEPLLVSRMMEQGPELEARVRELMGFVQLRPEHYDRLPHELSGGQQQRVNIARALATNPKVLVLDEPTASLDVSVRAEILKLLVRIQRELNLTYLLISHDLPTIRRVCDRVGVMYLGRLVEEGPAEQLFRAPAHPYTDFLLKSELPLDPDAPAPEIVVRRAADKRGARGCVFAGRCPVRVDACLEQQPAFEPVGPGHGAACLLTAAQK